MIATSLALALAQAAEANPVATCAAPVPVPAGMQGWEQPAPIAAGASTAETPVLPVGSAVTATLLPSARVTYAAAPAKPAAAASHGGVFAVTVATPGRYRVALGGAAWVDVVSASTPIASAAHGHGPACSTIRKMVDFDLKPGRYFVEVAGSTATVVRLMIVRMR